MLGEKSEPLKKELCNHRFLLLRFSLRPPKFSTPNERASITSSEVAQIPPMRCGRELSITNIIGYGNDRVVEQLWRGPLLR
jgi:hypothetical protein